MNHPSVFMVHCEYPTGQREKIAVPAYTPDQARKSISEMVREGSLPERTKILKIKLKMKGEGDA
jgi:hypothetical protein